MNFDSIKFIMYETRKDDAMRKIKRALFLLVTACFVFSLLPTIALAEGVYQVKFDTQGGSEIASISVEGGAVAASPEDPVRDGYEFTGWYKEPECASEWHFDTEAVTSDIVLYAGWRATTAEGVYKVKFDTQGGSEIESISVEEGALAALPEDPVRDGYEFTGWFKEAECANEWHFDTEAVTSDIVLYAGWKAIAVTVTITAVAGNPDYGTVTGGGEYNVGDTVTLTATPKEGFRFIRWTEPDVGSSRYSFKAEESRTVTAEFAPIKAPALTVVSIGFDIVRLSWTAVEGAAGYEIYRSTTKSGTYSNISKIDNAAKCEFIDHKLIAGKTYYYQIRAYCVSELVTTYSLYAAQSIAPPRGVIIKAAAVSAGSRSIQVTWSPVSGASGYEIYRSTTKSGTYSKVYTASSTAKSYTNTSLVTGKTYYYKVRGFCGSGNTPIFSDFSETASAIPTIPAPKLTVVPVSSTKNRLTWGVLTDVSGYEVHRSTTKSGSYSKIFTSADWPTAIYTNTGLTTGKTYYYKIRAFISSGGTASYGAWSAIQSAAPSAAAASKFKERSYTIYYQGDPKWRFSSSVSRTACVLTSYAITIKNMGMSATPRTVYDSNGKRTQMNMANLKKNFGVKAVCALAPGSIYLSSFNGHKTYIVKPSANAQAAIKEALNIHPEGVILYFKSGSRAHAIVACKYDGNTIYYSDPGRKKTTLLVFKDTWVSYHHHMTYANLVEMIALDKV